MKNTITFLLLLISFSLNAQEQTRDVLYLKNGSVIKGTVTEMNPSTGIKLKTADGSLFVYKMDEILKTEKEEFVGQQVNQETSSGVTQEALENHFKTFFKEKRPALNFVGISRVNGVKREIFGQKIYEVEYELIIEASQDLFISDIMSINGNGFKKDFSYLTKQPQGWDAYMNAGSKKLGKGQRVVANGTLNFEETDNGWRAKGFNNKNYKTVASDYVSPKMAQQQAKAKAQQAEDNAKRIAQLKKDLDWRTDDIEPVTFDQAYYSLKNIPFFGDGNSRFLIKPMRSYTGRNDVASNIQNTFYEALKSTNRFSETNEESYSQSANKANYMFLITRVDFNFKDTGYQCSIKVSGKAKGTYNQPNTYPFDYSFNLDAKSSSYKKNMSKAQALNNALDDFRGAVRGLIFKYNSTQLTFSRIITNKRGKVDVVAFKKPKQFVSVKKLKFILLKPSDLLVEDGEFKIKGKIGDCVFKGEIIGDEIICDVSGGKNKKAIANYINTNEQLIGISSF